ncbi:MAG: efflux RND transporter periplasmic adaptor subunit, partial [candidate division Zixibacteria bacterium]|nr:efflux RND transporter periplasmic adaptor subunit [candidate division Zixibacteria bacterium]
MPPTLVVTDTVSWMEFSDQVTLVGRTRARASSRIVAVVPGYIIKINAAEGVPVRRGDTLVTLSRQSIDLIYQAKKAEAREAQAQAELAQQNFKRAEELFAENAIAESRLDSERATANAARAHFEQLRAEELNKKLDLDNCAIRTPLSGYTVRQLVDIGEWVNVGDPDFEVVDLSEIKITVNLPERHFGHLLVGSAVSVVVSGDKNTSISGVVTGIAPSASEETHTFPVYVTVDNKDGRLGGGMLIRATLSLNK